MYVIILRSFIFIELVENEDVIFLITFSNNEFCAQTLHYNSYRVSIELALKRIKRIRSIKRIRALRELAMSVSIIIVIELVEIEDVILNYLFK